MLVAPLQFTVVTVYSKPDLKNSWNANQLHEQIFSPKLLIVTFSVLLDNTHLPDERVPTQFVVKKSTNLA